jgi:catalase
MAHDPAFVSEVIDAMNAIGGRHEGTRALHAKGTLLTGTFTATQEGARLCRSAHMRGDPVRVTARLSNGSGNPGAPDHARDGRGLAVKLYPPGGPTADMVAITSRTFFVRTPEDFLALTRARLPDPETGLPDPAVIGPFLEQHPETLAAVQEFLAAGHPPGYDRCRFNSLHAFGFTDLEGRVRWARWSWVPEAGEATIEAEEAKSLGDDYLREQILERAGGGGAAWQLELQLAADGDPLEDPTAAWPEDRERVVAGRLELTGPDAEREHGDDILVFDPTRVPDDIELPDDPILHFRRDAYSESVLRRSGVAREDQTA